MPNMMAVKCAVALYDHCDKNLQYPRDPSEGREITLKLDSYPPQNKSLLPITDIAFDLMHVLMHVASFFLLVHE